MISCSIADCDAKSSCSCPCHTPEVLENYHAAFFKKTWWCHGPLWRLHRESGSTCLLISSLLGLLLRVPLIIATAHIFLDCCGLAPRLYPIGWITPRISCGVESPILQMRQHRSRSRFLVTFCCVWFCLGWRASAGLPMWQARSPWSDSIPQAPCLYPVAVIPWPWRGSLMGRFVKTYFNVLVL